MPIYYREKNEFHIVPLEEVKPYIRDAPTVEFKVLMSIVWLTGVRISQILALKRSDCHVDHDKKTLTFVVNPIKRSKKTAFPTFSFSDPLVPYICDYIEGRPDGSKLFCKCQRMYRMMLHDLNVKLHGPEPCKAWLNFHYFRHSRSTFLTRVMKCSNEEYLSWFGTKVPDIYTTTREVERFRGKIR